MKINKSRTLSMTLAAVLAISSCNAVWMFQALGDEQGFGTISISSAEDLKEFSKNCRLDSWSAGRYAELTADIDLTGVEFEPIPVWGGSFNGNGYQITGVELTAETSSQGLFRYITKDGSVENLHVTGSYTSKENQEYLGGIAGSLEGTIRNCSFEGTIDGSSQVGGIVGVNRKTGWIENCIFRGSVDGEQCTGGIAGENKGMIANSKNHGRINSSSSENVELETMLSAGRDESILGKAGATLEKVRTVSEIFQDTGGIAGYSTGTIKECENIGIIGNEHIGYNVGGIAGRSSGYLLKCRNDGTVNGRKDVGGICGQMVPDIRLVFNEDTLDKLEDELSVLRNLADSASSHVNSNRSAISDRLDVISEYARMASDHTADLAEMTIDWADTNIEELNRLSDAIDEVVWRMEDIMEEGENALKSMGDGLDALDQLADCVEEIYGAASGEMEEIGETISVLKECKAQVKSDLDSIKRSVSELLQAGTEFDQETAESAINSITESAKDALQAMLTYKETLGILKGTLEELPDMDESFEGSLSSLTEFSEVLSGAAEDVEEIAGDLRKMFRSLAKRDPIEIQEFGDDYQEKGNQIHASVNAIGDQLDLLKEEADRTGDDISNDVERMEDQLQAISDLLQDAVTEVREKDKDDYWTDVSEENIRNTTSGKAERCVNYGAITGDINVGGIAGVMDIERTLDPEDEIVEEGEKSLNFRYETKVILESSVNQGTVTAKKNYAGGVCGRMSMGYILDCGSFSDVSSTDGDYVGGIAGQSMSTVRGSYSKGTMSGRNYVGGICGYGYDLYENTAFVRIEDASMYSGAVSGYVNEDGILSSNRFVEKDVAGVDGISYQGKAEPVSYESLIAEKETPKEFGEFRIRYLADDVIIASVQAGYGEKISSFAVPRVPEKKGYYAEWDGDVEEPVTFDTVIEARYTPYRTTIASESMRNSAHAVFLAEGIFMDHEILYAEPLVTEGKMEQWKISLSTENGEAISGIHTFRFMVQDGWKLSNLTLKTSEEAKEEVLTWTIDGSACVFRTDQSEFILTAVCDTHENGFVVWAAAGAAFLLAAFLFRFFKGKAAAKKV